MTPPPAPPEGQWQVQRWANRAATSAGNTYPLGVWLKMLADWHPDLAKWLEATPLEQAKKELPCWTIPQLYQPGKPRQAGHIQAHQPCALHDLDKLPPAALEPLLEDLRQCDHILLAHRTISGLGIRVLVRTWDWWEGEGGYPAAWQASKAYLLGLDAVIAEHLDDGVKDPSRVTYPLLVPPGEDRLWQPDTLPLPPPQEGAAAKPNLRPPAPPASHSEAPILPVAVEQARLLDALQACNPDCSSADWEHTVRAAASAGIPQRDCEAWSAGWGNYRESDRKRLENIYQTNRQQPGPGALILAAKKAGWDATYSRWQGHRGGEGGRPRGPAPTTQGNITPGRQELPLPPEAGDQACYEACLKALGVERRYDTIARRPEVKLDPARWPQPTGAAAQQLQIRGGWQWLTDGVDTTARLRANDTLGRPVEGKKVAQNVRWTLEAWRQHGISHDDLHQHDPLQTWLDSLPEPPEGEPASWLGIDTTGPFQVPKWASEHTEELAEWVGRYTLVVICARSLGQAKADIAPVLCGDQGAGKSSWLYHTLPPHLRHLWRSIDLTDQDPRRLYEKMDGAILSEWAELEGARAKDITRIKALLTDPQDSYRPAYGHHLRDVIRQGVIVATSNTPTPLPADETGNRRFAVVPVERANADPAAQGHAIEAWWEEHRDHLWALAHKIAKTGKLDGIITLPKHLADYQHDSNLEARHRSPTEEATRDILASFEEVSVTTLALWYMLPAALRQGTSYSRHTFQIAAALREAGWGGPHRRRAEKDAFVRHWTAPDIAPSPATAQQALVHEESYTQALPAPKSGPPEDI